MLGSLSRQSVPIELVPDVCGIANPPVRPRNSYSSFVSFVTTWPVPIPGKTPVWSSFN